MAVLWNRLADGNANSFHQEFSRDLERLNHFRETSSDPHLTFAALSRLLELKIFQAFREKFSRGELLRFQARLNKSN